MFLKKATILINLEDHKKSRQSKYYLLAPAAYLQSTPSISMTSP